MGSETIAAALATKKRYEESAKRGDAYIGVRLPVQVKDALSEIAGPLSTTISDVVRTAVYDYLAKEEGKSA